MNREEAEERKRDLRWIGLVTAIECSDWDLCVELIEQCEGEQDVKDLLLSMTISLTALVRAYSQVVGMETTEFLRRSAAEFTERYDT